MKDRVSAYPGRIKLTVVDEKNGIYDMAWADEPIERGTLLTKKTLLSDQACEEVLEDNENGTPSDMFQAIGKAAKIGSILRTVRTDLGDAWVLCNGDRIEENAYPQLCARLDFLSANNNTAVEVKGISTASVRGFGAPCYGNGKYVLIGYSYSDGYAWDFYESDDGVNYTKVRRGTESTLQDEVVHLGSLAYDGANFWFANYYDDYSHVFRFADPSETMTLVGSYKTYSGTAGIFFLDNNILMPCCSGDNTYILFSTDGGATFSKSSQAGSVSQTSYYSTLGPLQIGQYVYICTYRYDTYYYADISRFDMNDLPSPTRVFSIKTASGTTPKKIFTDGSYLYMSTTDGRIFYAPVNDDTNWQKVDVGHAINGYIDGFYLAADHYYTNDLFSGQWEYNANSDTTTSDKMLSKDGKQILYGISYIDRGYFLPTIASASTSTQKEYVYIKIKEDSV